MIDKAELTLLSVKRAIISNYKVSNWIASAYILANRLFFMASVIETKMSVCDKWIRVTAKNKEDGTIDINVESDCDALKHFAERLTNVSVEDVTNFETSRINKEETRGNMSMICLAPIMVYQAAWMEIGMMSKRIYSMQGPITMDGRAED